MTQNPYRPMSSRRCSRCHQTGHNVRTCDRGVPVGGVEQYRVRLPNETLPQWIVRMRDRGVVGRVCIQTTPIKWVFYDYLDPTTMVEYEREYNDVDSNEIEVFRWSANFSHPDFNIEDRFIRAEFPTDFRPLVFPDPIKKKKKCVPKHISDQIWLLNEPECMICLMPTTEEDYRLTLCGHDFCEKCLNDIRVDKCGVCRESIPTI